MPFLFFFLLIAHLFDLQLPFKTADDLFSFFVLLIASFFHDLQAQFTLEKADKTSNKKFFAHQGGKGCDSWIIFYLEKIDICSSRGGLTLKTPLVYAPVPSNNNSDMDINSTSLGL
jgi:hypothetical protein